MKTEILVKEVMKTNPVIVKATATVFEAARHMKQKKIGNVIVVENKQPIGILTESDILRKVVAEGKDSDKVLVEEVMTTPVIVTDPYISIDQAMKLMGKSNIRRLPVVEDNKLIGIITLRDIARISPTFHEIMREWNDITPQERIFFEEQSLSGKCEDCATLSTSLKNIQGRLICEECAEEYKTE
ncbi:MAG: CBS domain-containing protein [Candidatus Thermoplasmatota archaeon]